MLNKEKVLEIFHETINDPIDTNFDVAYPERRLWYYNGWVEGAVEFCKLLLDELNKEQEEVEVVYE